MYGLEKSSTIFNVSSVYALPALIILLTLLNSFFNSMAVALGYGFPFNTFCFSASDLFADLIKTALSFPGPEIQNLDSWPALYRNYLQENPYGGVSALVKGELSNLHGMPLPTLLLLSVRYLLSFLNPSLVTVTFFSLAIVPFCVFILLESKKSAVKLLGATAYLLSYPLILAFTRGNLTAILLGEALVVVIMLISRGGSLRLIILLLAVAVNLRPNALIFFALPLLQWPFRKTLAAALVAMFISALIFVCVFSAANYIYPDYTFGNFYKALLVYRQLYSLGGLGTAYGSSLLGGLKFLNLLFQSPIQVWILELATSLLGVFFIIAWVIVAILKRLSFVSGLFCFLSIYALFSGVFADYHLIVFFSIVVLYISLNKSPLSKIRSAQFWIAICSAAILAPKNYVFYEGLSAQVLINPLILACGALLVSKLSFCASKNSKIVENPHSVPNIFFYD